MIESFKILKRIENLAYEFELSLNIYIYNVILIGYLKLIIDSIKDFYYRRRLLTFTIVINGEKEFEIEKLLQKKN